MLRPRSKAGTVRQVPDKVSELGRVRGAVAAPRKAAAAASVGLHCPSSPTGRPGKKLPAPR